MFKCFMTNRFVFPTYDVLQNRELSICLGRQGIENIDNNSLLRVPIVFSVPTPMAVGG